MSESKEEIIKQIEELCTEYDLQESQASGEYMIETITLKALHNYTSKANLLQLKRYVEFELDRGSSQ
tara:strand:+ start:353 stop:553 length:201 start_codon:yes stop_codon:yes gene_type:complete